MLRLVARAGTEAERPVNEIVLEIIRLIAWANRERVTTNKASKTIVEQCIEANY